ncbi:hypothetical protein HDU97_003726 [Phlyctochytrium planicorne]|nr:hypothetical protein HDU97_003726 [Phlyctochytrium planicorne]
MSSFQMFEFSSAAHDEGHHLFARSTCQGVQGRVCCVANGVYVGWCPDTETCNFSTRTCDPKRAGISIYLIISLSVGAVGGLAILAWWLWKRNQRRKAALAADAATTVVYADAPQPAYDPKLDPYAAQQPGVYDPKMATAYPDAYAQPQYAAPQYAAQPVPQQQYADPNAAYAQPQQQPYAAQPQPPQQPFYDPNAHYQAQPQPQGYAQPQQQHPPQGYAPQPGVYH